MREHSFATLISSASDEPLITHVPVIVDEVTGIIRAHVARANPIWQDFASGREVLIVFHGPHHYVSPSWYASHPSVPTWNYAAVHVSGIPSVVDGHTKQGRDKIESILQELIDENEANFPQPWKMELPADYLQKMINGIVAFEVSITRITGKFKLSQNRPPVDRINVVAALRESGKDDALEVANLMELITHSKDQ